MNTTRKAYQDEMEEQLKGCSEKIDEIKAKALQAQPREKLRLYDRLEDLLIKEKGVRVELATLKESAMEAWDKQRVVLETNMHALQADLDHVPNGQLER